MPLCRLQLIIGTWWARLLNVISGLLGEGTPPVTNSYESIQTYTVGAGGSSSITFSSIPSTYKHLQFRVLAKSSNGSDYGSVNRFNSDSGSNYVQYHQIYGQGSSATATAGALSANNMEFLYMPGTNRSSSTFGAYVIDILDYTNTNKNKTVRNLGGFDDNGAGYIIQRSHLWMNTNAIDTISFISSAGTFAQYSSFALYGIKG